MSTPTGSPPTGKGRPTPKRSDAQQRRGGPVAPPPATRKEAAKRAKEQAALARVQAKQGTARGSVPGDERSMVARDRGPVRALVRDVVDSRRNVGVLLLPLALLLVVAQLSRNQLVLSVALTLWLAGLVAVAVDIAVTTVTLRSRVKAAFPGEAKMVGHVGYGLLRSTVFRRLRMPTTRTAPGRKRAA
ncbi:MAG: DUF3043 domain-containing protein [Frankiales bacterium]|nr:DUF3043 domain-containing protein [Frankiales bacterium]